jgi:hypothetical protein
VACNQIEATLKDAVLANFNKESISSLKPIDRTIDNRYWLSRLADVRSVPPHILTPLKRMNYAGCSETCR